ncbi:MAG: hypothetical protein R3281_04055 [Balneolaceae bacterium]|nr:hypothetical protein [Balneolaceae bacterium]
MSKISLLITLFILYCSVLVAQPLRENAVLSGTTTIPAEHAETDELTMSDFRYAVASDPLSGRVAGILRSSPGAALVGSALVPGLGQAVNDKWIRAGAYLLADAVFLAVHLTNQRRAEKLQREYERFADDNWSVVTYAQWLVAYHEQNGVANPYIWELENQVEGVNPTYNPDTDWNTVNLQTLRRVERNTPFISPEGSGNAFSHEMPNYGSQQYYELISKYYQYGPGWNNFGVNSNGDPIDSRYQLAWNGSDMPPHFFEGADMADRFNNKYRVAGNMLAYMLLNHVVSAFDAFVTVKLKNNRLQTRTNFLGPQQFTITYRF